MAASVRLCCTAGVEEADALIWQRHIENLVASGIKSTPAKATTQWLNSLSSDDRLRLEACGLVEQSSESKQKKTQPTCPTSPKFFIDWYINRRSVKPATVTKWNQTRDALTRFFGEDRKVDSITAADAEAWREWFATKGNNREGKPRADGSPPGRLSVSRIGGLRGLRCPSETLRLKWEDVNFEGGSLRIHASKTEHHKDGGVRLCPLFPELRICLDSLGD